MDRAALVNQALADVLRGAYTTARFTQPQLAEVTGINERTIQRIMAGSAPVTMGQLEKIALAVRRSPAELFEDALAKADRDELSADAGTPTSLDAKRKQRQAAAMSGGALEDQAKKAATRDEELDSEEPEAP